jgi:hypothetical protein
MLQVDNLAVGRTSLGEVVERVVNDAFRIIAPSLRSKDRYVIQFGVNLVRALKIFLSLFSKK